MESPRSKAEPRDAYDTRRGSLDVYTGKVIGFTGGLNRYLVRLDMGGPPLIAVSGALGSTFFGSRGSVRIAVGTPVTVVTSIRQDRQSEAAVIIACQSPLVENESLIQGDYDAGGNPAGFPFDQLHARKLLTDPKFEGWYNAVNYEPVDGLTGEWGQYSPLGPATHVGPFMSYLRACDRVGVWAFRIQELLRLQSVNLQLQSMAEESDQTLDEGEIRLVRSLAMYPWEALGAFDQDTPPAELSGEDPFITSPIVPVERGLQRGIFRLRELGGYLGDLSKQFVGLPLGSGVDRQTSRGQMQGLFLRDLGPDGSLRVQSAKSLSFEKYSAIPYPSELARPEEPEGDTLENYRPSGVYGEGEEHVRQDFGYASNDQPYLRAGLALEHHGFLRRHTLNVLRRHARDWEVPEESQLPLATELRAIDLSTFQLRQDRMWMPLPNVREVDIDHRLKGVKLYASRSAITQHDDGSITIEDGYGSQIIMSGGNIMLAAANDVVLAPGRNLVGMAGNDLSLRAYKSADLTAGRGDLRLKAQKNLQVIQNDENEGGILIDCRNSRRTYDFENPGEQSDIGGLVLRAADGVTTLLSNDLSILVGGQGQGRMITQVRGDCSVVASSLQYDISSRLQMILGDSSELRQGEIAAQTIYEFTAGTCVLGSRSSGGSAAVQVMGGLTLYGALTEETDATVASRARVEAERRAAPSRGALVSEIIGDTRDSSYFELDGVLDNVIASLRTVEDYQTSGDEAWVSFEFRWQEFARTQLGDGLTTWQEPEVVGRGGQPGLPYPGYEPWARESRVVRRTGDQFFSIAQGFALPGEATAGENVVEVRRVVAQDTYVVNSKAT